MPNIKNIVQGHNKSVLNSSRIEAEQNQKCNCKNKDACPLNGNCLAEGVAYRGNLSCEEDETIQFKYIGVSEDIFKSRYNNHAMSFRDPKYSMKTKLSRKYWELNNSGLTPKVSWETIQTVKK